MANKPRGKMIWCVYNHMPYGTVVATHFETLTRTRKVGNDGTQEVTFTAENQAENFRKAPHVALYTVKPGQEPRLEKNKVLLCPVDQDSKDPASDALAYAAQQGVTFMPVPARRPASPDTQALEARVSGLEVKLADALNKLAGALDRFAPTK